MKEIFVSDLALENMSKQISKRATPPIHIRFGVQGNGCSGYKYFFEFEDKAAKSTDHQFMFEIEPENNIWIVVDKKSMLLLDGTTIDWKNDLMETGYIFINPQAKSSCGCGESFSIK